MSLPSLAILIPAFNTEKTLEHVITRANSVGRTVTRKLEIIVVNDASADGTASILSKLQKKIPAIRVVTHAKNLGYGATIRELYELAKYDWLFSLPSDDQFDAGEIKKLIPFTGTYDMILGLREVRHDSWRRLFQSRMYNFLLALLFGLQLRDTNTIRLMKKEVIDGVSLKTFSAFVDAELAIRAKEKGFRIIEVPVTHKLRKDSGATGGKLGKTILPTIRDMLRVRFP